MKFVARSCSLIGIIAITLLFIACTRQKAAYEFSHIPTEGWEPNDTLHFSTDTIQNGGNYMLSLNLRTSVSTPYPFRSIWIIVKSDWANSTIHACDTIECHLTNENGELIGHGISLYQYSFPVRQMSLSKGDCAHISVHHFMQRELLNGIVDVGIELAK